MNPSVPGNPASESRRMDRETAKAGFLFHMPEKVKKERRKPST